MSAWQDGITGTGSTIAIIDTGIDTDSPEFAGRLHPDSVDVAGNSSVEAVDDHGTLVALVAAAARDDLGVVGIAFDANVLALRADRPGTCNAGSDASLDGCEFADLDIAAGVDQAIASGATVLNLSLGGSPPTRSLNEAIARAAAAGIVIVVSAGNDGDTTDAAIDPNQPDPFAAGLLAAGGANVIIVGSVDESGAFSDFSNRAGNSAGSFISARGEAICCIYEDGELQVTTNADGSFVTLFSGTSFAAPQVAGAVALLAQAFPNLTGAEIVEILLGSAREAGAPGTDARFGTGILDIAASLQPSGTTTLAGTTISVALSDDTGIASSPMGDALVNASIKTVITDRYDRAFGYDFGGRIRSASIRPRLLGAMQQQGRRVARSKGGIAMAYTVADNRRAVSVSQLHLTGEQADQAQVLAARIAVKLAPDTDLAFAFAEGAQGLALQLQGQGRPAFLIAGEASSDTGFFQRSDASVAVRRKVGRWGLTMSADRGDVWLSSARRAEGVLVRQPERHNISNFALAADHNLGPVNTVTSLSWMQEQGTVLGAFFHDSIGNSGADTLFLDGSLGYDFASNWRIGGALRQGFTRVRRSGLIAGGSDFSSRAWSVDIMRGNIFERGDSLGLRVSQPLRVSGGGLNLALPIAYDYATESAIFGNRRLSLAPEGREIMAELAWRGQLWGGSTAASIFYRQQPGHVAASPDDAGAAFKWNTAF
ncbi:hypothetical protein GCM10023115_10010 [Pontixanthobacter gangjinensis]|uniref:S8 family peptidase n=1 Tax=Pontixanthobacter gangjinensis TaxID=1028742 RepID=UPI002E268F9A